MIVFIAVFLVFINEGMSACNQCTAFNVKCVSSSQYQYCISSTGASIGSPFACPTNQICSVILANGTIPCITKKAGLTPDCTCGYCNQLGYACVSATELKLCFDALNPSGPTISCPNNLTCDFASNSGSFCGRDVDSTCGSVINTTVSPATLATTTISNPPSCSGPGRYPETNTNCTSYYLCAFNLTTWQPIKYTCLSGALYNPNTQKCTRNYNCTG